MNALIWFTGVITKYKVGPYNIKELEINKDLYIKLSSKYNLYFLIVTNDINEQHDYVELISKHGLTNCKLMFIPYLNDNTFLESFYEVYKHLGRIDKYVDYSKIRLMILNNNGIPSTCLSHISEYLN